MGIDRIMLAFAGFCPVALLLRKISVKSGAAF